MSDHWLVRPKSIKRLWIVFSVILALTVIADFFIEHHGVFGVEGTFGFSAWYGLVSCVGLVVFSKAISVLLKRSDKYYAD